MFLIKRLIFTFFMAIFSSFLCFCMIYYSKGSVAFSQSSNLISSKTIAKIENNLNLNQPLLTQYKEWSLKAIKGDFSNSLINGEKVSKIFTEHLGASLILAFSALFLIFVLSIVLAMFCVMYKDSIFDKFVNIISLGFLSLPTFALALLFILIFSFYLKILPSSGMSDIGYEDDFFNRLKHILMPLFVLVLSNLAIFLRFVKSTFIESLNQSFVQNALAKGLSLKRVYFHFVLKHSLNSILSFFSSYAVGFLMSTYVVESVFSYGGIGEIFIQSIIFKDYPVVLFMVVFSVLASNFLILISDILQFIINPRLINA